MAIGFSSFRSQKHSPPQERVARLMARVAAEAKPLSLVKFHDAKTSRVHHWYGLLVDVIIAIALRKKGATSMEALWRWRRGVNVAWIHQISMHLMYSAMDFLTYIPVKGKNDCHTQTLYSKISFKNRCSRCFWDLSSQILIKKWPSSSLRFISLLLRVLKSNKRRL